VLAVALAARLIVLAADDGYRPANDAHDFHRHAASIAGGDGYPEAIYSGGGGDSAFRPPGYPLFLAGVYAAAGATGGEAQPFAADDGEEASYGDAWAAGRVANALLGVLAVLLVYLIANRLWGRRVALIAGTLAAVFPPLVLLATELMSESLFVALELGCVLAVLAFRDRGTLRWAALAGLLAAVAALTRSNGLVLIPLAMLGVWIARPWLTWTAVRAPATVLIAAVLAIAPWTVRNWVETGRFIPTTTQLGFGMAGTYNQSSFEDDERHAAWRVPALVEPYSSLFLPDVDEPTLHSTLRRESTRFALDHPGYVLEATFWNALRTLDLAESGVVTTAGEPVTDRGVGASRSWLESAGFYLVGLLAVPGVVVLVRWREDPGPLFLWLTPLLLVAGLLPIIGLPRYRAPADPFIVMLAAIALAHAWSWLDRRHAKSAPAPA
jgi:4-amino-4-deoxy-L-arabinose transferase-like glycosyltransferase